MEIQRQARIRGTRSLAVRIALKGGRQGKSTFVGSWEPYCDKPVVIDRRITSREGVRQLSIGKLKVRDEVTAMEVSMKAPCRRCAKCLQFRQMKWRERAIYECAGANRTWFVTLTFAPIHLAGILMEAKGGETCQIERAAYRHVQLFFKRLRKLKCVFRYLAVYERGEETGRSHYHLLLHETGTRPILKEVLECQWRSFIHARLVGGEEACRHASYVTKYTTKSFEIRPRASRGYGKIALRQISREI